MTEDSAEPNPAVVQTEVEKRITVAVKRSRMFQVVTAVLAIVWVCAAVAVTSHIRKEQRAAAEAIRIAEQQKAAEQLKQNKQETEALKRQAENTRIASNYVVSGIYEATHGNANGALAYYNKALSYDPNNPAALSYEGYLRFRLGQSEKAEEMLGRSVELDPNQAWNRYNFALTLWANGKHDQALTQVKEVVKLDSTFKTTLAKDPQFKAFRASSAFKELIKP
jgi:tetratricopeptide (TPR) repeat protein